MKARESVKQLESIAQDNYASINTDYSDNGEYIDCEIVKDNIKIYVILTKFNDDYYAYNFDSDIAPSEFYLDLKSDSPTLVSRREKEIFSNITLLLNKKLRYHKKPSMLNRERGYVELNIDGKTTKIWQKRNLLGLPET